MYGGEKPVKCSKGSYLESELKAFHETDDWECEEIA